MDGYPDALEAFEQEFIEGKYDDDLLRKAIPQNNSILAMSFVQKFKEKLANEAEEKKLMEEEVSFHLL